MMRNLMQSSLEQLMGLARNDLNFVIHGRNLEKLNRVREEIIEMYPRIDVRIAILHAAQTSCPKAIVDVVKDLHATILINCLGIVGDGSYQPFEGETDHSIEAIMNANAIFPTLLTRHLLAQLRQSSSSLILNLSSGTALATPAFLAPYAGSKVYNLAFSHALSNEMRYLNTNIHVLAVLVGSVNSAANQSPVSFFCPSSLHYAKTLLQRIDQHGSVITDNWQHGLQMKFAEYIPYWIIVYILSRMTHDRAIQITKRK